MRGRLRAFFQKGPACRDASEKSSRLVKHIMVVNFQALRPMPPTLSPRPKASLRPGSASVAVAVAAVAAGVAVAAVVAAAGGWWLSRNTNNKSPPP